VAAIDSGEYAIQSARLGLCRLALFRLGAALDPLEMTSDDSYIWDEDESDLSTATWTEDATLD
jgi:hypothetical protein